MFKKEKDFSTATKICKILESKGFIALFVGGTVRDSILNKKSHDIDICTDASPDTVERLFKNTTDVGKKFGTIVVFLDGKEFEITTLRKDSLNSNGRKPNEINFSSVSLEEDANRRDFTMNGIFFNPIKEEFIDFVGGVDDIRNRIIRFIGNPNKRIEEDNLRSLRAIRFASTLGFSIEENSMEAIKKHAKDISNHVSSERIKAELDKILLSEKPSIGLRLFLETGVLLNILPEVEVLNRVPQSKIWHSEGNPFVHSLNVLDAVRKSSDDIPTLYGALFHDVGKVNFIIEKNGKISNNGHDVSGAIIAENVAKRLKFTTKDTKKIVFIVREHMRIKLANEMKLSKKRRLKNSPFFKDALLVSLKDSLTTVPIDKEHVIDTSFANAFLDIDDKELSFFKPILNGNDLIKIGFVPGKELGNALKELTEFQLNSKEQITEEEALNFVNKFKS